MGKIILFIIAGYILYYALQIIYDGFLKKPVAGKDHERGEEIFFGDLSDVEKKYSEKVFLEDVQQLNIPNKMKGTERIIDPVIHTSNEDEQYDNFDSSEIAEMYAEEQSFNLYENELEPQGQKSNQDVQKKVVNESVLGKFIEQISIGSANILAVSTEVVKSNAQKFEKFFDHADHYYVVEDHAGTTVYRSTIF